MANPRDVYADSLRAALEAMRETRGQLRATEVANRRALRALHEGHRVEEILDLIAAASTRIRPRQSASRYAEEARL